MVLGFRLRELMAKHKVTGRSLSQYTGLSEVAISKLKQCDVLPEVGGNQLGKLAKALSEITGKQITPIDLVSNLELS